MKAAATRVEGRNEVAELDRSFFIWFTSKSRTMHIAAAMLVVKRWRYDRVRLKITVLARLGFSWRLAYALVDRDWDQAAQLIEKMKGSEDDGFAYAFRPVPVQCYSILISRLRKGHPSSTAGFTAAREQLSLKVSKSPQDAALLSQLAVVDALLNNSQTAISEAKRAAEMLPVSKDPMFAPRILRI